jgi:hypothetical protein
MFANTRQLEAARIFHFVNKCDWRTARYFALSLTASEIETVISTHPDWRDKQ